MACSMAFSSRRLLRDHLAFGAAVCQLAYILHGATVPPERAEALRQADLDQHAKQRRAGLG
eukprot:3968519-Pyramimonas_sp.AAC.1